MSKRSLKEIDPLKFSEEGEYFIDPNLKIQMPNHLSPLLAMLHIASSTRFDIDNIFIDSYLDQCIQYGANPSELISSSELKNKFINVDLEKNSRIPLDVINQSEYKISPIGCSIFLGKIEFIEKFGEASKNQVHYKTKDNDYDAFDLSAYSGSFEAFKEIEKINNSKLDFPKLSKNIDLLISNRVNYLCDQNISTRSPAFKFCSHMMMQGGELDLIASPRGFAWIASHVAEANISDLNKKLSSAFTHGKSANGQDEYIPFEVALESGNIEALASILAHDLDFDQKLSNGQSIRERLESEGGDINTIWQSTQAQKVAQNILKQIGMFKIPRKKKI